ncbi:MAG TPA: hypothetical protein ENK00_02645 [Chromatiales bacterium]|nr:hypothetical protein [Chromatiales bacterium]
MPETMDNDRWSMISAVFGTLLVIGTLLLIWSQLQRIEARADRIYAQAVLVQLELDSLEKEMLALEGVLRAAREQRGKGAARIEVGGIRYSEDEIRRLESELRGFGDIIAVKRKTLAALNRSKASVLLDLQILFWGSLFSLLVGVIAAALGYLSWFHKVRIFRDRRHGPRAEDLQAFEEAPGPR